MNTSPYEVLATGAVDVYVAPVGSAFPDLQEDPTTASPDAWTLVGSSGNLNYDSDAGIKVSHSQSLKPWMGLGSVGTRKIFRSSEEQKVAVTLVDITLEQYKHAINSNTVTTVAGTPGTPGTDPDVTSHRKIGLSRGFSVATVALLIKVRASGYGDGTPEWTSQYEIPLAAQSGNPEPVFKKDTPVMLALEWTTLVDPNAASEDEQFGRFVMQDDDAS